MFFYHVPSHCKKMHQIVAIVISEKCIYIMQVKICRLNCSHMYVVSLNFDESFFFFYLNYGSQTSLNTLFLFICTVYNHVFLPLVQHLKAVAWKTVRRMARYIPSWPFFLVLWKDIEGYYQEELAAVWYYILQAFKKICCMVIRRTLFY